METYIVVVLAVIVAICVLTHRKKPHKTEEDPNKKDERSGSGLETTISVPKEYPVYWYENGSKVEGVAKMAQGLQVFDSRRNIILDLSTTLIRILGTKNLTDTSGSITVDCEDNARVWAYTYNNSASDDSYPIKITISGHVISWEYTRDCADAFVGTPGNHEELVYGTY